MPLVRGLIGLLVILFWHFALNTSEERSMNPFPPIENLRTFTPASPVNLSPLGKKEASRRLTTYFALFESTLKLSAWISESVPLD